CAPWLDRKTVIAPQGARNDGQENKQDGKRIR
ncbi:hypothetical protein AAUPMC_00740, partial [Pasteurella multocida subsp. multocida str. Anand1_cattle]